MRTARQVRRAIGIRKTRKKTRHGHEPGSGAYRHELQKARDKDYIELKAVRELERKEAAAKRAAEALKQETDHAAQQA